MKQLKYISSTILFSIFLTTNVWSLAPNPPNSSSKKAPPCAHVQVCENKDCLKRFSTSSSESLAQIIQSLLPPPSQSSSSNPNPNPAATVQTTGCLGQCGKGPNVSIRTNDGYERIFGGVTDGQMASAILEVGAGIDVSNGVLVAVDVILKVSSPRGQKLSPKEKIEMLTPAIDSLSKTTKDAKSTALAHALLLRADAFLELGSNNADDHALLKARQDAEHAIAIDVNIHGIANGDSSWVSDGRAYRVLADAYEARGDVLGAIEAMSNWASVNPKFATKARKEIARLGTIGDDRRDGGIGGTDGNLMA